MKKKYKFYYLIGGILLIFFVLVAIFGISLTIVFPNNNTIGWVGLIIVAVSVIIIFYSIYLLKKGNYLKINFILSNKSSEKNQEKK